MWCDDFDMDLLKVIPGAVEALALARAGDIQLYTHGHTTDGTLNHPSVWNSDIGMIAFFGFDAAHKPESYSTNELAVACTFEQAVRDAWCHDYHIVLCQPGLPQGLVWGRAHHKMIGMFNELMYHRRHWITQPDDHIRRIERDVLKSLQQAIKNIRLSHYFWQEMAEAQHKGNG